VVNCEIRQRIHCALVDDRGGRSTEGYVRGVGHNVGAVELEGPRYVVSASGQCSAREIRQVSVHIKLAVAASDRECPVVGEIPRGSEMAPTADPEGAVVNCEIRQRIHCALVDDRGGRSTEGYVR